MSTAHLQTLGGYWYRAQQTPEGYDISHRTEYLSLCCAQDGEHVFGYCGLILDGASRGSPPVGRILVERKRDALISRQPRWSNCRDRSWTKRKKLKSLPEIDLDMTRLSLMSRDRAFSGSETPSLLPTEGPTQNSDLKQTLKWQSIILQAIQALDHGAHSAGRWICR